LAVNRLVAGSNPARGAKYFKEITGASLRKSLSAPSKVTH
jgi:hypothetical protein